MNGRPESDETLVERLLPGRNDNPEDRASAWNEWYLQEGEAAVLGFIKARNDSSELDTDILQETMLTAFMETERGRYEPRGGVPFTAYVKGIARNKIREARRKPRWLSLNEELHPLLEGDCGHPETVVERQEWAETLHGGLDRLAPDRQRVLNGYLNGHNTMEIAKALEMTEALVRQHKSRGLRSLRESSVFQDYRHSQ
jgi:RNA polymerase sigma factor (sigma-70 family)